MPSEVTEGRRRVLVTGGGGFIGRHLVAAQAALGREVVALDLDLNAVTGVSAEVPLQLLEGDIADPELQRRAVQGVDTVFNLAAAHLSVSAEGSEFRRVNVDALQSLAARCADAGVRRFVHCSTVGVFGALKTLPADEATACNPEYEYEKTKLEGEKLLLEFYRKDGFPVVILRPAWVYGPGCPRTHKLFRAIRRGVFVMAGKGDAYRHSVYIRDMITALEQAASEDSALGRIIIIADQEAVTVRSLVRRISHIVDASPPRSVPLPLLYWAGAAAEAVFGLVGREPPLSRRSLRFFSGNTSFHTARARDLLGFHPEYGISDGLEETFEIMERGEFWECPLPPPSPGRRP